MRRQMSVFRGRVFVVMVSVCALVFCCLGVGAQPPAAGGGPGGGPGGPGGPGALERNEKAWEIQANSVAKSLSLSADQTTKLVKAYKEARESYIKAFEALRGEQGSQRDRGKFMEVGKAEKAKFEAAIKGFLKPEQLSAALSSLGSFNRRWDSMVMALDGMKLDEKKMAEAMKLVIDFVVEQDKLMQTMASGGDFQAMREKMRPLREKLDTDMAKVLSADEMTKWTEATQMRGRGGRRN